MKVNEPLRRNPGTGPDRAKMLLIAAWLVLTPAMLFAGF